MKFCSNFDLRSLSEGGVAVVKVVIGTILDDAIDAGVLFELLDGLLFGFVFEARDCEDDVRLKFIDAIIDCMFDDGVANDLRFKALHALTKKKKRRKNEPFLLPSVLFFAAHKIDGIGKNSEAKEQIGQRKPGVCFADHYNDHVN